MLGFRLYVPDAPADAFPVADAVSMPVPDPLHTRS